MLLLFLYFNFCHIIQREHRNNVVSDDVDAGYKVKLFDSKVVRKKLNSILCMDKVTHYCDVGSISVVDFIDKQRNGNDTMIFSIKLFGIYENNIKFPNNDSS